MYEEQQTLTLGQQHVRKIVTSNLDAYHAATNGKDKGLLYDQVISQFRSDPIITTDSITGQLLGFKRVARSYYNLLVKYSVATPFKRDFPPVTLSNFIYEYVGAQEKEDIHAYEGGVERKRHSTISCLFGLAENKVLASYSLYGIYLENSGILANDGGNHRSLAHVLWGQPYINFESLTWLKEQIPLDQELNQALLVVDSIQPANGGFKFVDYTTREIDHIKEFASLITDSEKIILTNYVQHLDNSDRYTGSESVRTIDGLEETLIELRSLIKPSASRSFLKNSWFQKFKSSRPEPISDFALWYKSNYSV